MAVDIGKGRYWSKSVNVFTGCTPIQGWGQPCQHCWATAMCRLRPEVDGGHDFKPTFHPERLKLLRLRKPEIVFANITGDWCHPAFTDEQREQMAAGMAATPRSVCAPGQGPLGTSLQRICGDQRLRNGVDTPR